MVVVRSKFLFSISQIFAVILFLSLAACSQGGVGGGTALDGSSVSGAAMDGTSGGGSTNLTPTQSEGTGKAKIDPGQDFLDQDQKDSYNPNEPAAKKLDGPPPPPGTPWHDLAFDNGNLEDPQDHMQGNSCECKDANGNYNGFYLPACCPGYTPPAPKK